MNFVLNGKNRGNNVVNIVWKLAEPIAKDLGLKIWDIKFLKEGSNYYLRIFIDNERNNLYNYKQIKRLNCIFIHGGLGNEKRGY